MIDILNIFIKIFGNYICSSIIFFKITALSKNSIFKLILLCFVTATTMIILKPFIPIILLHIIIFIFYNFILTKICKKKYSYVCIASIISMAFTLIFFITSAAIICFVWFLLQTFNYKTPIYFVIILLLELVFQHLFFNIKRFKHGFSFLNTHHDFIEILLFAVCIIIIIIYFFIGNYKEINLKNLFATMLLLSLLILPIIQKTFILYQKQKLLTKTLKEYEAELQETKSKLNTALKEKYKLVKTNHEFYHRQEALKQKLNTLLTNQSNYTLETAEEYSVILDRIDTLSKEYTSKIKSTPSLPKTSIPEIDDMFTYMQSECEKYDIEFILKINADIRDMLEKLIPQNKLETLIGDLIRNAIIAVNHSTNKFKSIMVILGIKDNFFELCVHDSGINFEIETLLKLGTEAITTHKDDGGTGIGFVTTFETLNYCNASLIINEFSSQNSTYSKSIVIRFDNKHSYIINSYRANEFIINGKRNLFINQLDI